MSEILLFGGKFVTLPLGMKKMLMKICAVLLTIWYSMSVIGFDMHTCKDSGNVFIAMFKEGCSEIHPHDHCASHSCHDCCSHESCCHDEETALDSNGCCTDSYQVIVLTGCRADDEQDFSCSPTGYCAYIAENQHYIAYLYRHPAFSSPVFGDIVPCDPQAAFGIWRI